MSAITSRGLDIGRAYPVAGALSGVTRGPGPSQVGVIERESRQVGGEIISVYT
jgi:hypothetical protein